MDEQAVKREVKKALEDHQPKYDERGRARTCDCGTTFGSSEAIADHQAYEVMRRLRSAGFLA
jgi:hypothetical protein